MKLTKFISRLLLILVFVYTSCETDDETTESDLEYIQYTVDGGEPVIILEDINANFYPGSANFPSPKLEIFSFTNNYNTCFLIRGILNDLNNLGTYDVLDFQDINDEGFTIDDMEWIYPCSDEFNINSNNVNIIYNLTTLGEVGEYIDINFNGSYEDLDSNLHTINGVVHVLRDE